MNSHKTDADKKLVLGQALLGGVIFIFVATMLVVGTLAYSFHERRMSNHSAVWVEALHVAEAGVEDAVSEFYKAASSESAWIGWSNLTTNVSIKVLPYTDVDPGNPLVRQYGVRVNVDTYEIFSSSRVDVASYNSVLGRSVGIVLEPDYGSPFEAALLAKSYIKHGGNASVDSFDSSDPLKSTNGQFDEFKRQTNGDIVTICTDAEAAVFATGSGTLYGDIVAGLGGGVKISGNYTNMGAVGSGAETDISDVIIPMDTTLTDPPIKLVGGDAQTITVAGATDMAVSYVKATGGSLLIEGSGVLRLYVEGELSISGSSEMIISNSPPTADLRVEIYANGYVMLNSCVNETGNAANLGIYGTELCDDVHYTGDSEFAGFMYTPYADFEFSGQGDFVGAVVANTIGVSGSGNFHYDEALRDMNMPFLLGYRIVKWVEL